MPTTKSAIQVKGLGKRKMAAIVQRAKRLGMTPQRYLRHLVEEDLAISERARSYLGDSPPHETRDPARLVTFPIAFGRRGPVGLAGRGEDPQSHGPRASCPRAA